MLETIYLVRHGFRLSWETNAWNAPTGTPRDPPLSAYGVVQAQETAKHFHSLLPIDEAPQKIYSSPLYRCLQTAAPLSKLMELPINVEFGFSEWYLPVKRGLHPRSLPPQRLTEWFPTIDPSYSNLMYPTQKGETKDEIHARGIEIMRLLINQIEENDPDIRRIVIFTHAATNIAMGRGLVGDRERTIGSGTCSIGRYDRIENDKWELRGGQTSSEHLSNGEERNWWFDLVEEYEEDGIIDDEEAEDKVPLASESYGKGAGKL